MLTFCGANRAQWWQEGVITMADQRLPVVLQMLRISIDRTGEVAAGYPRTETWFRQTAGVLRDSQGRRYLLFENENGRRGTTSRAAHRAASRWHRSVIAVLWLLGAASLFVAAWCGIVLFAS
jgi:hypothetical protein